MLFLQGGALLQFGMVPMNLLRGTGKSADYIVTGTWSKKAHDEAKTQGAVHVAWDGKPGNFNRVPPAERAEARPQRGLRLHRLATRRSRACSIPKEPEVGDVPLVCDASSDFLSRPVPIEKYGILFACAQKNAGPAGVTIVIIRDDLVERSPADLPSMVNYKVLAEGKSLLNTPPTFAIYMVKLVTDWLLNEIGGLEKMAEINRRQGEAALRRDRPLRRLLSGPRRAGQPLDDERAVPPGQPGPRRAVPEAGGRARAGRAEGPSLASAAAGRRSTTPCPSKACNCWPTSCTSSARRTSRLLTTGRIDYAERQDQAIVGVSPFILMWLLMMGGMIAAWVARLLAWVRPEPGRNALS